MLRGLSKREIEIISSLEFDEKYFFNSEDIEKFSKNTTQRYNIIKNLLKKKRIVKLNKTKYYLIPIKAKSGSWSEHPFVIADEACNSKDYFIGGWAAANYWHLTDQVPMQEDVYTTRRQGKKKILNVRLVFHRTTKKNIEKESTIQKIEEHAFSMLKKESAEQWMKPRK